MTDAQRTKAGSLRWLWEKCREHATNAVIGGGILVFTGFTPEHWVAHLLDGFHLSDLRTIWPSDIDPRLFIFTLGIIGIVADVLWRKHRVSTPVVDMLRQQPNLDEVNFWAPSAAKLRALQRRELFLFKLHTPRDVIAGDGIFA